MTHADLELRVVDERAWREARLQLLEAEKNFTRLKDGLAAQRRALPVQEVVKDYRFEGPAGAASLRDLFEDRQQLIVQHVMFNEPWEEGCPSCRAFTNDLGDVGNLHARGLTYALVSRAPYERIESYRKEMGWSLPYYSSLSSDFNLDFNVTMVEGNPDREYNYRSVDEHRRRGTEYYTKGEQPGLSVFIRDGDRVFHSYSTYARGVDHLSFTLNFLDLTPLGRQED